MSNNAKRVLFRKGTTAEHQLFTGARGEVTVDITKNIAIVHNGITTGGHELVGVAATGQSIVNKDSIGIGTAVADSALTVEGDARVSGIITSNILDTNNLISSNINVGILTGYNNTISLSTSIIPDSNESYDLGSSTNKFRDLYLSGNTLKLGDASLSSSSETLNVSGVGLGVSQFNAERLHVSGISTFAANVSFGSSALFDDNDKILLGNDNDFEIYHDGSSYVSSTNAASNLFITSGLSLQLRVNSSELALAAIPNGAVELFHNNSKKFETTGVGVTVLGTTQTQQLNVSGDSVLGSLNSGVSTASSLNVTGTSLFQGNVDLSDNIQLRLGTGNDLQLYHESNNSYINNIVGNLYIRDNGGSIHIQPQSGEESAVFNGNTSVDLYYNGVKKFETTLTGIDVTGHTETDTLNVSGVSTFTGIDVTGHTETDTLNVSGVSTFNSDVGIGTTNPTNAALHVAGRNLSLGGPGYNNSGESNLYLGDYNAPANNTYDPNIRVGTRDEFQFEIESDYGNGTRSNNTFFASPTAVGLNVYGDSNSPGTIFYYNYSRTAADQYLYFSANSKYLWFDGDTGRLGVNRSTGNGWTDTLDVNGTARVTGVAKFDSNVGIGTTSNLTANLTIGNIEETSTTNKGALAIKTLANSNTDIGHSAIYIEEPTSGYGFYTKVSNVYSTTAYQIGSDYSFSYGAPFTISDYGDVGIKTNYTDTFCLKLLSEVENVIKIENNNNGSFGSDIRIFQDSNSPAANDKLLTLDVRGNDSGGNETIYSKVIASIEDPTDGSEDGKFTIQTRTNGTLTDRIVISGTGVGIGTDNPSEELDVIGNISASGDVTAFSDITLKKNIELIPNALDKVLSLRGITYNRIDIENEPKQSGVIAQEVEKVLPEVVHTNEEGIKSVAYGNMVGLLIEAIKELKDEIETLKKEKN